MRTSAIQLVAGLLLLHAHCAMTCIAATGPDVDKLVGQPVDIAPSAYQYRADRRPEDNPPESWFALMRYANMPLNKPVDLNAPAIKRVLCSLLWEEIRPIRRVELIWAADAKNRPKADELTFNTLDSQGTASSWWNNLTPAQKTVAQKTVTPTVSENGNIYTFDLPVDACGLVIGLSGGKPAAEYAVPTVRVLVADRWKKIDFEIEWGYEPGNAAKDYSGRIELYDGRMAGLVPLDRDKGTATTGATSWTSTGRSGPRRGVQASLLYMGTSKWRRTIPFTSQADDVARTIVTVWTKSGNFSFLAADLENGPILAPEFGFFVRRTTPLPPPKSTSPRDLRVPRVLLTSKMKAIAGTARLVGWGSDNTPWFGGNSSDKPVSALGITIPAKSLAMHPGPAESVAAAWRSPIAGRVNIKARVAHAQSGGDGIEWWIARDTETQRQFLAHGTTDGSGSRAIPNPADAKALSQVAVAVGDMISLIVGRKGTHFCDTTLIKLAITEVAEVGRRERVWNLTDDVVPTLLASNPHADGMGHADVWQFFAEKTTSNSPLLPSEPPIVLASQAACARDFIKEHQGKKLSTIRERIRAHEEQTWEGAVTAMRGFELPPHPSAPSEFAPPMQIEVPSARLTAQWNLGIWHLLRHCQKNPQTGRLWFNDYPYGILGAETYMVLAALDLMGMHQAAADGFDQWLSLPMDPSSAGHHPLALPDRPNGLFSEGHGCLTHAIGPPGVGGQMDGIHAFGPGSIGWALIEHYRLTGDATWFKASAPRIKANVEWILRQRRVMKDAVPGGERLWCKGLQPAQQVTPDSGGLWMQFYECEAYYWVAAAHFAEALATIDPAEGARLKAETEAYRKDLLSAVERTIALSPVVPVRDGTFHSVIPFACYVRGLSTGSWGWKRDGSGSHVGPMYWETVQSAAALISPAALLPTDDVRVQGYLDVLEDRLLLENKYVNGRDWFTAGWQYQGGLERTANMHLAGDDIPVFIRSFLTGYAIDILPADGYTFNEHAVHGPPDKIFEEAAFLERFRNLLVMEQGGTLWIARAAPRAWLEQGKKIIVKNAPTHFGAMAYEIDSDVDHGKITATIELPSRGTPDAILLRLRHPKAAPIKSVTVNGKNWAKFNSGKETIELHGLRGTVGVTANY